MALFEAVHAQNIAFALQRELGGNPDTIRFGLFVENGTMHVLVAGRSHLVGTFSQVISPTPGESLMRFLRRCALWGASQLAPYSTALYLLQEHAADKDFTDVVALVENAKALLPATPTSFDRALLDNILGLVALFRNDTPAARKAFDDAMAADPTNAQCGLHRHAVQRIPEGGRPNGGADPPRATRQQGFARHRLHDLGCGPDGIA